MVSDETIKKIADIGFMAATNGMSKHAFGIFCALEKVRPDSVLPSLGFATVFINKKMNQEALEILHKEAMPKDPDSPAVKAFIGLALMLEGRNKESENTLSSVSATGEVEARAMAEELLAEIRQG